MCIVHNIIIPGIYRIYYITEKADNNNSNELQEKSESVDYEDSKSSLGTLVLIYIFINP